MGKSRDPAALAGQRAASLTGFAVIDPEPEVVLIAIRAQAVE